MSWRPRFPNWTCFALALLGWGCADDVRCDSDQVYVEGACLAASSGGTSSGAGGSSVGGAAGAAGGSGFGTTCMTSAECAEPAPFCAALPGQAGICTVRGCNGNPAVCPGGYSCQEPVPTYDLCLPE
jgi:hypothetical protein